ncbi:hypothetical protein PHMEG_00034627, partial [Phytophthora megakarya]
GGSRGNPGPGGSGAVIVQLNGSISSGTAVWISSTSYHTKTTTNNQAEYRGLLQGLLQAHRSRMLPLHVVGDSKMIIEQQRKRHSPRAEHLSHFYKRCRVLADKCNVLSWTHHFRSFNKTADTLANLPMDTQPSRQLQVYSRDNIVECWRPVLSWVANDISNWLEIKSVSDSLVVRYCAPI